MAPSHPGTVKANLLQPSFAPSTNKNTLGNLDDEVIFYSEHFNAVKGVVDILDPEDGAGMKRVLHMVDSVVFL